MTDIWVCGNCHSINRQRSKNCYKCGAAQAVAATDDGATHRQEQAIAMRSVVAYRPAAALGLAASIFLLGLAAVQVFAIIESLGLARFFAGQLDLLKASGTFDRSALDARMADASRLDIVGLAVVLPALLFFAAWLSRVVSNVPALGGGLPGASPWRAFVTTLIPVTNLRTVPGIIQDVLYRLDPKAGGIFMVGIAWFGLVGSWILSYFAGRYVNLRITFDIRNATSLDQAIESLRTLLTAALIIDVDAWLIEQP